MPSGAYTLIAKVVEAAQQLADLLLLDEADKDERHNPVKTS